MAIKVLTGVSLFSSRGLDLERQASSEHVSRQGRDPGAKSWVLCVPRCDLGSLPGLWPWGLLTVPCGYLRAHLHGHSLFLAPAVVRPSVLGLGVGGSQGPVTGSRDRGAGQSAGMQDTPPALGGGAWTL